MHVGVVNNQNKGKKPVPSADQFIFSSHIMLALTGFVGNLQTYLTNYKTAGYNHLWAYTDNYYDEYVNKLADVLDAAEAVGGLTVSVGTSGNSGTDGTAAMIAAVINRSCAYKVNGKLVVMQYDHNNATWNTAMDYMEAVYSISRIQVLCVASRTYPLFFDGAWQQGQTPVPVSYEAVASLYSVSAELGGLTNFAVNQGNSGEPGDYLANTLDNIRSHNLLITQYGRANNKFSLPGFSQFYASATYFYFKFHQCASIWQDIIDLPVSSRPNGMTDTTANDYAELSYTVELPESANGLAFVPNPNANFSLGANIRYKLTDHSGINKFLRPWIDAFLNKASAPSFASNKIFCSYWLHPRDAALIPTIPTELLALNKPQFTQTLWEQSMYYTGSAQINFIKQYIGSMDKIEMAAHLTAPAYLRIVIGGNTYTSPLRSAGAAYWECPQALGTPVFSILASDGSTVVKTGSGLQAITNFCYPGGWNPLISEL